MRKTQNERVGWSVARYARIIQLRIPVGTDLTVSDKGREALGWQKEGGYDVRTYARAHGKASSIARDGLSTDRVIM